jgi:hypothetical protein
MLRAYIIKQLEGLTLVTKKLETGHKELAELAKQFSKWKVTQNFSADLLFAANQMGRLQEYVNQEVLRVSAKIIAHLREELKQRRAISFVEDEEPEITALVKV